MIDFYYWSWEEYKEMLWFAFGRYNIDLGYTEWGLDVK